MTRTFRFGLLVRIGWPTAHPIADALNRIRGPSMSRPAIALVAALADQPGARPSSITRLAAGSMRPFPDGLASRRAPQFSPPHFGATNGKSAVAPILHERRIILRRVEEYGLPAPAHDHRQGRREPAALDALTAFMSGNGVPPMKEPLLPLALIGVGLIGSSIARAARAHGAVREIVATARSPKTRKRVAELGIADKVVETNAEAVKGADLVIVCIPVGACGAVAKEMGPHLKPGATVSDVGSVKSSIVRDMGAHLPKTVHFVPAHPVAGTEHSGPDAGFAELFEARWCILTPPKADAEVDRLAAFWPHQRQPNPFGP
jgi:hypothetical protein